MFKRLIKFLKSGKKEFSRNGISLATSLEGIPLHRFTDFESYLLAASKRVWASFKAIDIIANVILDTEFNFQTGKEKVIENPPADLKRIFEYPNPYETWSDFLYKKVFHIKATGNAYIYKSETRLDFKRPRELYLLNPKWVSVVPSNKNKIRGYVYRVNGIEIPFERREIIHTFRPHPNNEYYGIGDMEAAEPLLNNMINRDTWEEKFLENGASPSGILAVKTNIDDEAEFERMKEKFNKQYTGKTNIGKVAFIQGENAEYTQLGISQVEMQNLESKRQSVEDIFTLHGVPLSVAGVKDAANYATAQISDSSFRRYTIKPLLKIIRDTLNTDLVSDWGDIQMAHMLSGLEPVGQLIQDFQPFFDRGGMSINEWRAKVGMSTDPDNALWNMHFIDSRLVPLEMAGTVDTSSNTGQRAMRMLDEYKNLNGESELPKLNGNHRQ